MTKLSIEDTLLIEKSIKDLQNILKKVHDKEGDQWIRCFLTQAQTNMLRVKDDIDWIRKGQFEYET